MPTLYIIINDMSSLGRFFSRSRFELPLMFIHSMSASFTLWASRSHCICFVATQSRWTATASWVDASHLQQPRLVN